MSTEQPEAPAIPRLVTQEELAGYFKRLRFTDPRDAAANAFAEIQAHREPAPDPLIMPDGEFQATRTVAEALRLASGPPATEHGEAVTAVRRGLDLAAPFADADREIIASAREALRVLGGEETDAGPGEAIVETLEALPASAAPLEREHVQDLIAAELERRAEAAEAKLAAIRDLVEAGWPGLRPSTRLGSGTAVPRILAIAGTGEAETCPPTRESASSAITGAATSRSSLTRI